MGVLLSRGVHLDVGRWFLVLKVHDSMWYLETLEVDWALTIRTLARAWDLARSRVFSQDWANEDS